MNWRAAPVVLSLLVAGEAGVPGRAHAEDSYIVTLTDQGDKSRSVSTRCSGARPCTATLRMALGTVDADIIFRLEMGPQGFECRSADWEAQGWHFELLPDGSGAFPIGRSPGTLWLVRNGGLQPPVVRDPGATRVGHIEVSVKHHDRAPSPSGAKEGEERIPM